MPLRPLRNGQPAASSSGSIRRFRVSHSDSVPGDDQSADEMEQLWSALPAEAGERTVPGRLGYRGCLVRGREDVEWLVYEDLVIQRTPSRMETRIDRSRAVERLVFSTAPAGLRALLPNRGREGDP